MSSVHTSATLSIDQVVSQISDPNLRTAIVSCIKLDGMLVDPETPEIMASRVNLILAMVASQMRRRQPTIPTLSEANLLELNKFFRASVGLLSVLFKGEFLPRKATTNYLREIIEQLLMLIIDENLELLVDAPSIIKNVNVLVVRVIENTEPSSITCALISLLNETLKITQYEPSRMLELVMKCQWKELQQYKVWVTKNYDWDVKAILLEYSAFVREHPFSAFQNKDITPLKTIKTIIRSLVTQLGCEIFQFHMNSMPELRDSEAGHYLSKIIQRELVSKRRMELE